jgi:hypothetical protein
VNLQEISLFEICRGERENAKVDFHFVLQRNRLLHAILVWLFLKVHVPRQMQIVTITQRSHNTHSMRNMQPISKALSSPEMPTGLHMTRL